MKKILSVVVILCMLVSALIIPTMVQAVDTNAAYKESTLGNYYKFTFGENGDRFDYTSSGDKENDPIGQHTYKSNTFYPLWAYGNAENIDHTYKTIEDARGNSYDVLELKAKNYAYFVPLTKEGKPFEMTPGVEYVVNIEYFNTASAQNAYMYFSAGTSNNKEDFDCSGREWKEDGTYEDNDLQYTSMPFRTSYINSEHNVYVKDGTVTKEPMILNNIKGSGNQTVEVYKKESFALGIPVKAEATYDATTYSYNVKTRYNVIGNNYFTLALGQYSYVTSNTNPLYSNGTTADIGTGIPNTWQIVSIEIYEKSVIPYVADSVIAVDGVKVKDGHTYKVDISYTAEQMNGDVEFNLFSADPKNAHNYKSLVDSKPFVIKKHQTKTGKTYSKTVYFTADLAGESKYSIVGSDYTVYAIYNQLYLYFNQSDAENSLVFKEIKVTDLGNVIETGGASILVPEVEETVNEQAIRYFFNYETEDGSKLTMDGKEFDVVARGFIYKNGALNDGMYNAGLILGNEGDSSIKKTEKTKDFNSCWKYENGRMTYSVYCTDFEIDDEREVVVRGYITLKDAQTNEEFTIYSNTINRSVLGVKEQDNDIQDNQLIKGKELVWSEEFSDEVGSMPDSQDSDFTLKVDTMGGVSAVVPYLKVSDSSDNVYIKDGILVMRITSDGNKNYTIPASVSTYDKMAFAYGYLEMRAKVPCVSGVWPSFWLRPDLKLNQSAYRGEIDIFEIYGTKHEQPDSIYNYGSANLHKWVPGQDSCNSSKGNRVYLDGTNTTFFSYDSNEYNIFGFEWTPEFVAFYVNGELYCKMAIGEKGDFCTHDTNLDGVYDHAGNMDCFDQPYYICLNNWAFNEYDQPRNEAQSINKFPDLGNVDYSVDYIRLYQDTTTDSIQLY